MTRVAATLAGRRFDSASDEISTVRLCVESVDGEEVAIRLAGAEEVSPGFGWVGFVVNADALMRALAAAREGYEPAGEAVSASSRPTASGGGLAGDLPAAFLLPGERPPRQP